MIKLQRRVRIKSSLRTNTSDLIGASLSFLAGASDIEVIEKPKENEPPADPAHAIIKSNKETVIEINVNSKPLGLFVTGGKMLQPPVVN